MKKVFPLLSLILALALLLLTGCSEAGPAASELPSPSASAPDASASASASPQSEDAFSYSAGISDDGMWEGIKALDYIKLCEYKGISIPADSHTVTDAELKTGIDKLLADYAEEKHVTEREVENGDTVNIDYVGSVDGVEFANGSTGGNGTDVTIGVTTYIDDFLQQLIGHKPGETMNVEVTFPTPYQNNPDLAGKDAVFVTTINYIVVNETPELTDEFAAKSLAADYGWNTADEATKGVGEELKTQKLEAFVRDYMMENCAINEYPETMIAYQESLVVAYYQSYADMYNIPLETFLPQYAGFKSTEEMLEQFKEQNQEAVKYLLIIQAIAEDAGIKATDDDVTEYFAKYMNGANVSTYESQFGAPYLAQVALTQTVIDQIVASATME